MNDANATPSAAQRRADSYDVTIVGGGISGLLLALRLATALPAARIAVLEKEAALGGRLSGNVPHLHLVSRELVDFLVETLADAGTTDLHKLTTPRLHSQLAMIAAPTRVISIERNALFSSATVQQLGSRTLAAVWEELCAETHAEKLKKTLKSIDQPLAALLDRFAVMLNLPSLSGVSVAQLHRGIAALQPHARVSADWLQALPALTRAAGICVATECRVVEAQRCERGWTLHSARGTHHSRVLVVAQPPWSAMEWLPMQYWPAQLAQMTRRSKPHSAVCLVTTQGKELPLEACVVAEGVHALSTVNSELALARVLSYETRLRAPAVTAAVGKLKRALRSLHKVYGAAAQPRLIALISAAYCLPLGEVRADSRMLFFCGDSCGTSEDGDSNIIASVLYVCDRVVDLLKGEDV